MELPLPVKAVDLALSTIAPYRRPDLEARLRQTRARLLDDRIRVLVVGEFKQGKSMLVNALVGAPDLPGVRRRRDVGGHGGAVRRGAHLAVVRHARARRDAGRAAGGAHRRPDRRAGRRGRPARRGVVQPRQPGAAAPRRGRGAAAILLKAGWRSSTPPASAG